MKSSPYIYEYKRVKTTVDYSYVYKYEVRPLMITLMKGD